MLEAAWWGFVGGSALLIGALLGVYLPTPAKVIGLIMAFGGGVLICALSFDLTGEAYREAGATTVTLGLLAGSLVFFGGDWFIDRRGGERRKSPTGHQAGAAGMALALGALLDGIPESAAIGVSLLGGGSVGAAMVVAVFLSNVPEALSSSTGMKIAGRSNGYIFGLWLTVTAASAMAAALGYALLGDATPSAVAFIQAFAAGAILTMLADTMLPEAVDHAGALVGLLSVLGFSTAVLLSAP